MNEKISETAVVAKPKIDKAEVNLYNIPYTDNVLMGLELNKTAKYKCNEIGYWNVCEFLAKQLEEYLNEK